ncbi:hypothetical protein [uncultured Adlercreutzia sp.]|uniref:hypothetical protein n=1 Tax=uncultured Adlercreutzia sp. TaxID=875803 RepID=UPI0026F38D0F|nr:hypothetical protein [uncultured Adlercreutzia sp.]
MSFDDNFARAYREAVEDEGIPAGLADRTLKAVRTEIARYDDGECAPMAPSRSGSSRAFAPRVSHTRRWAAVGGACLAAAIAFALAAPVALPSLEEVLRTSASIEPESGDAEGTSTGIEGAAGNSTSADGHTSGTSSAEDAAPAGPGLTLRAYAADGSELALPSDATAAEGELPPWARDMTSSWGDPYAGENPTVALFYPNGASGSGSDTMWPEEDGSVTTAVFWPDTFTVEGSNIVRVQIHVSQGELYRQTIDRDVHGIYKVGLRLLDPRLRGSLAGYQDCDALGTYDRLVQNDEGHWHTVQDVFRMKRMGKIIDLSKEDDSRVGTRDIQFGYLDTANTENPGELNWMSDNHFANSLNKPANSVNGSTLTITATFDDGSCETQVVAVRREGFVANDDGTAPAEPYERYSAEAMKTGRSRIDVAYGVLVSKTDDPFPYANEPANLYADAVMPPMPAYSEPYSID